jgi:hypothetical protein
MRLVLTTTLACLVAVPALAADMSVRVAIPALDVAEYHRPYVAIWIERPDHSVAAPVALWYDVRKHNGEGTEWLKDLRQFWRRVGREMTVPADGITGPTQAPGIHEINLDPAVSSLPAGDYTLVVEAAREVGGRELLSLPFSVPSTGAQSPAAEGKSELGRITLNLKP